MEYSPWSISSHLSCSYNPLFFILIWYAMRILCWDLWYNIKETTWVVMRGKNRLLIPVALRVEVMLVSEETLQVWLLTLTLGTQGYIWCTVMPGMFGMVLITKASVPHKHVWVFCQGQPSVCQNTL